jgi:3-dehydroquinate synthase
LTHGEAIAIGMICEAFLSKILRAMPDSDLKAISNFIVKHYGKYDIEQFDADYLISLMKQDKKNERDEINFTFLRQAGEVEINCTAPPQYIKESLKYYSSL